VLTSPFSLVTSYFDVAGMSQVEHHLSRSLQAWATSDFVGRDHACSYGQGARFGGLNETDGRLLRRRAILMCGGLVAQLHRLIRCGIDARVVDALAKVAVAVRLAVAHKKRKVRRGDRTMVTLLPTASNGGHLRYTYEPQSPGMPDRPASEAEYSKRISGLVPRPSMFVTYAMPTPQTHFTKAFQGVRRRRFLPAASYPVPACH